MPIFLRPDTPGFEAAFEAFAAARRETTDDVSEVVKGIIADIRARGDVALAELTRRFDQAAVEPGAFRVSAEEIAGARRACASDTLEALDFAARRIKAFHRAQLPADLSLVDDAGVALGMRWRPIDSVGLYVPGGQAAYPSSVLMNAIPASVAGVRRRVMTVPATGGMLNPLVLAAADLANVSEIYRIGGAQAIAALAYGTESIPAVDKIVGPGNIYVAAAKRQVFGTVGIDSIAGPSEILVVADGMNDPAWIAVDLLAQAEHDRTAQAILLTDDAGFADRVVTEIDVVLSRMPRSAIAAASWRDHGAVIVVDSLADAPSLVDRLAPEHLELAVTEPEALAACISNAGAIFLGRYSPEAIGDYVAGPNHVLPTGRSARFSSGLSVADFLKRTTWVRCDADSLQQIGPAAITLARAEGLEAHAQSVLIRLGGME